MFLNLGLVLVQHPLQPGQEFCSLGCHYTYRVVGACCRLFDREELPWPCCRLDWRGKEPSWRRVGRRLVPDMAAKNSPSYAVQILGQGQVEEPMILTLYWVKLPQPIRDWWYARLSPQSETAETFTLPKESEPSTCSRLG